MRFYYLNDEIRYGRYLDDDGENMIHFEVFKKPFWFGFMRQKRWEYVISTNDFMSGVSFSEFFLEDSKKSFFSKR